MIWTPRRTLHLQPDRQWHQLPRPRHGFFNCNCCPEVSCSVCGGSAPAQYALSVSGITNGACTNCTAWNGDWILTNDSLVFESGNPCKWSTPVELGTGPCEPGCGDCSRWTLVLTSTTAALMADENQMAAYRLDIEDFDCMAGGTFPRLTGSLHCNNWPASLTLTPL